MSKQNTKVQSVEDSIKNYASQFVTLDSFVEAVRTNIGMYLGGRNNRGMATMIREIFQNSFEEMIRPNTVSPGSYVIVEYNESDKTTVIEDDGRGIPFDVIIRAFTKNHTSTSYSREPYMYGMSRHGSGSKCVNACSSEFIVESYILGKAMRCRFVDGVPDKKGLHEIPNLNNKQGTIIRFTPSREVLGEITLTCRDVIEFIRSMAFLGNKGDRIIFRGVDITGKTITEEFINEDGIDTYLINICTKPIVFPVHYSIKEPEYACDFTFTYDLDKSTNSEPLLLGYANYTPTRMGTHINGFYKGIIAFFRKYMNNIYLANNKKKLTVTPSDIKCGLVGVLNACKLSPTFVGQDKDQLSDEEMEDYVANFIVSSLEVWSKERPADLQKICKYLKDIAEVRTKSDGDKVKLSNQYKSSATSDLPDKYVRPRKKKGLELLIVEGDSALGSARNSRDIDIQGIMPIRGKLPNAFSTPRNKFLANEEIAGIISILDAGYGRSFDISKCNYDKLIFLTDADPDGAHIKTLLLAFALLYLRPMIEEGRVYAAVPPLFGIRRGEKTIKGSKKKKQVYEYFTGKLDFVRYTQKEFGKNNVISTLSGNRLTQTESVDLIFKNMDYVYELETVANHYAINPHLLELVLYLVSKNTSDAQLKKKVKERFPFLELNKTGDTMIIRGLIGDKFQTMFLNDKIISKCEEIIKFIVQVNGGEIYKYLNGNMASIYDIMNIFDASSPKELTRYKGLGEMNPEQLGESALRPDSNRLLLRYTLEDAQQEIEQIRYLQSNKDKLLEGVEVTRRQLLG